MESYIKITKQIALVLTEGEALWLKDMVQNPLGYDADEEPIYERNMREKFWNAIDNLRTTTEDED